MTLEEQERAFLTGIRERPNETALRLGFADWLEKLEDGQNGYAARAEFIRVQCAIAEKNRPLLEHLDLVAREGELLREHAAAWARPLRDLGAVAVSFQRGLPETIHIRAGNLLTHGDQLFALAPLQRVKILETSIGEEVIGALASFPHLRNLRELDLGSSHIGDAGVRALAASPHLQNLRELDLGGNAISDAGTRALAASPYLANLTRLDLGVNTISDEGARALANSPYLANLTTLNLRANAVGPAVLREVERHLSPPPAAADQSPHPGPG